MMNVSLATIRVKSVFAIIALVFLCGPQSHGQVTPVKMEPRIAKLMEGPFFWQQKKDLYAAMLNKAEVPVSVTEGKDGWSFKGAGIVKAPKEFTFSKAKDFNQLKQLKEHFSNIAISSDGRNLNLGVRFLGKERVIEIKTKVVDQENPRVLSFEVAEGLMKGLYGVLIVKDVERREGQPIDPNSCEVALVAYVSESTAWVPDFLFGIGAEGIMRHVAISLRNLVEKDYKNQIK